MRKIIFLITLLVTSCTSNQDKTPSIKEQIQEQMLIFASRDIQISQQMISAPYDIKEAIGPIIDKARYYGTSADELYHNKDRQYSNRPPYNRLNNKQLLDSLKSLEKAQQLIIKQATEIEIQYIKEH